MKTVVPVERLLDQTLAKFVFLRLLQNHSAKTTSVSVVCTRAERDDGFGVFLVESQRMRSEIEVVGWSSPEFLVEGHIWSMRPIEDSYVRISRRALIEVSTSLVDGFVFPRVPVDEVRSVDSFWLVHRMPSHHVHLLFDQILVDLQLLNRGELIAGVGF